MSETPILNAPVYEHGYVTGRYLTAVADGPDLDRLMDFTPAKGKVIFTPENVIRRYEGPAPAVVVQRPVTCELDNQGYLMTPGSGPGVTLIVGIYTVRFDVQDAQVPGPKRIQVKASHTEDAPLDLVLAMPDVVPPGSVVVVDETTAQRAEAAAARAEAIVADIDAEVRAAVLASPELKGEKGDDGDDGHTPALSWQGTALTVDGVPGPDLRGPAGDDGDPGPAPSLKIGTVTSGTTPAATIKGTSPDLTLDLVLAKGDPGTKGDTGAPGVVSSASSYVIVGPGRPDVPSTTAGTITGNEPVGARYESTDEAGVGARTWRKVAGGKWIVTNGDTGLRSIGGDVFIQRINNVVYLTTGENVPVGDNVATIPSDWRPVQPDYQWVSARGGTSFTTFLRLSQGSLHRISAAPNARWNPSWVVTSAWPTAPLPGNPA